MMRHLLTRIAFFILGLLLFYAPFAFLTQILLVLTESPLVADAHRICLRMPFEWLAQPWMYPVMIAQPLYLVGPVLLPLVALFFGPIFCGWLCPSGMLTEFLSRLVPDRFKLNLAGKVSPEHIRLGILVAMFLSPFLGGYICCTFCNFTMMQNLVLATTGDFTGLQSWASFTILTFVLWFFIGGIFMKGGRGWCTFICPAGAFQGIFHKLGIRLGISRSIQTRESHCTSCKKCQKSCPTWAISEPGKINAHLCTICRDCIHVCPENAIIYSLSKRS